MTTTTSLAEQATALLAERDWENNANAGHIWRGQALLADGHLDEVGTAWMVKALQACPFKLGHRPTGATRREPIPDGRYLAGGRRLHVTTQTAGQWAGFTSVREQNSGTGSWSSYLKGAARRTALAAIEQAGWQAAAIAYGRATSRCGFCNTELRDRISVATAVGPRCREKHNIPAVKPQPEGS